MSALRTCAACRHVARTAAKSEQLANATRSIRHFSVRTSQRQQQAQATESPFAPPSEPSTQPQRSSMRLSDILQQSASKTPTPIADRLSSMGLGHGRRRERPLTGNSSYFADRTAGDGAGSGVNNLLDSLVARRSAKNGFSDRQAEPQPPMRLRPTAGRTVHVEKTHGGDPSRAFRQLDQLVARNKVRNDLFKQRFHERPGLRRKRLAYESKIRVFKDNFAKTVAMVRSMAKSGW